LHCSFIKSVFYKKLNLKKKLLTHITIYNDLYIHNSRMTVDPQQKKNLYKDPSQVFIVATPSVALYSLAYLYNVVVKGQ